MGVELEVECRLDQHNNIVFDFYKLDHKRFVVEEQIFEVEYSVDKDRFGFRFRNNHHQVMQILEPQLPLQ